VTEAEKGRTASDFHPYISASGWGGRETRNKPRIKSPGEGSSEHYSGSSEIPKEPYMAEQEDKVEDVIVCRGKKGWRGRADDPLLGVCEHHGTEDPLGFRKEKFGHPHEKGERRAGLPKGAGRSTAVGILRLKDDCYNMTRKETTSTTESIQGSERRDWASADAGWLSCTRTGEKTREGKGRSSIPKTQGLHTRGWR